MYELFCDMFLCVVHYICNVRSSRINYMPYRYPKEDNNDNNGAYSYQYHDRRSPEDNTLYKQKNNNDNGMDFNRRLYENMEQVLRKQSIFNIYHNNGLVDYNNYVKEQVGQGTATPSEYKDFKEVEKEEIRTEEEGQPIAGERNNVNKDKEKFDIFKWLEDKDNVMENDSEEELQKMLELERKEQEEEINEQKKKAEIKEKEAAKDMDNRKIRFLQWVKKKLEIQ